MNEQDITIMKVHFVKPMDSQLYASHRNVFVLTDNFQQAVNTANKYVNGTPVRENGWICADVDVVFKEKIIARELVSAIFPRETIAPKQHRLDKDEGFQRVREIWNRQRETERTEKILLTAGEVAFMLGVSLRTVRRLQEDDLPPVRFGSATRWPISDVKAFIEKLKAQREQTEA